MLLQNEINKIRHGQSAAANGDDAPAFVVVAAAGAPAIVSQVSSRAAPVVGRQSG